MADSDSDTEMLSLNPFFSRAAGGGLLYFRNPFTRRPPWLDSDEPMVSISTESIFLNPRREQVSSGKSLLDVPLIQVPAVVAYFKYLLHGHRTHEEEEYRRFYEYLDAGANSNRLPAFEYEGNRFFVLGEGVSSDKEFAISLVAPPFVKSSVNYRSRSPTLQIAMRRLGTIPNHAQTQTVTFYYSVSGQSSCSGRLLSPSSLASKALRFKGSFQDDRDIQLHAIHITAEGDWDTESPEVTWSTGDPWLIHFTISWTANRLPCFPFHTLPDDLIIYIASLVSLKDVTHLCQAIPTLRPLLSIEPQRRVQRLLAPYFDYPVDFVHKLVECSSIVAGSTIVHALKPGDWTPGDLDLVASPVYRHRLVDYLEQQGYARQDDNPATAPTPAAPAPQNALAARLYLLGADNRSFGWKHEKYYKGDLKIDLMTPYNHHPIDTLLAYHSTTPMVCYTGKLLLCMFPMYFFYGQYLLNLAKPGWLDENRTKAALRKYEDRGWKAPASGVTTIQEADLGLGRLLSFTINDLKKGIWRAKCDF